MTKASGSFHEKDNRSAEQQKIIELPNVIGNKDGERHFKTSSADFRTKVNVIKANAHKYSVSAMCKVLNIPRSTYYYKVKQKTEENGLTTDKTLETFHIDCLLSKKGCPYDNAAAEATFKIIKTEFVKGKEYETLEQLQYELSDFVNWFNNHRFHSSLGYMTPKEYRLTNLK